MTTEPNVRKTRLVDCSPSWATRADGGSPCWIRFDCPEGHPGCWHLLPFSPNLDGKDVARRAKWDRIGDTFETLTLTPSIRRRPVIHDDGVVFDACALHIVITNGAIEFCADSK